MSYASIEEAMLNGVGIERSFLCHHHDDHNASASVNSITGLYYCYACHASGRFDMERMEIDPYNVRRTVEQIVMKNTVQARIYPESWLDQFDAMGPGEYWLSRFSAEICREHRLGQALNGHYATIPYRASSGKLLGIIKRDLTGLDPAKYRYPEGVDMTDTLYNYARARGRTLLLTEGATDTIAAEEVGFTGAMATYGSSISRAQIKLVNAFNPLVILVGFDQDGAGESGYHKIKARLAHYPIRRLRWDEYKDLASLPLRTRAEVLGTAPKKIRIIAGQGR